MITKLVRTIIIALSLIILSEILRYYKVYSTLIQNTESRFINNPIILSATIAIIALLAGSYLWNSKKNVLPNQNLGYIALGFIGLSIYYFFCIYPFFKSEYFLALFIFLIIIIGIKIIHIINKNKSDKIVEINDLSDNSITTPSEDKYEYYISAENLLKRILTAPHYFKDRSLCVGIEASWGHGKTSFLNLIEYSVTVDKESVNYNKAIIIKFNAWMSSSNQQLTENFMATLSEGLTPYNPNITSKIAHYSRTLSNADLGWLSKIVKIVTPPIETSLEKQFEDLSNCIGEINKPIIVYIDDMDRLFFTEIMGVLKLIRNTASFKNTVFIVPYDRDYVIEQLEHNNISENYLEKMFNLPYSLPPLNQEKKNLIYKDIICKTLSVKKANESQVDDFLKAVDEDFTLRTIKIFLSKIQVKRSYLDSINLGDISLLDLLIMEYIRLYYPKVYNCLVDMLFTQAFNNTQEDFQYLMFKGKNNYETLLYTTDSSTTDNTSKKIYKDYIYQNHNTISEIEWEKAYLLLEILFANMSISKSIHYIPNAPYKVSNPNILKAYLSESSINENSTFITYNEFNPIKETLSNTDKSLKEMFESRLENRDIELVYSLMKNIIFATKEEGLILLYKATQYMVNLFNETSNYNERPILLGLSIYDSRTDISEAAYKLNNETLNTFYNDTTNNSSIELYFKLKTLIYKRRTIKVLYPDESFRNKLKHHMDSELSLNTLYSNYLQKHLELNNKGEKMNITFEYIKWLNKLFLEADLKDSIKNKLLEYLKNNLVLFMKQVNLDIYTNVLILKILFYKENSTSYNMSDIFESYKQFILKHSNKIAYTLILDYIENLDHAIENIKNGSIVEVKTVYS